MSKASRSMMSVLMALLLVFSIFAVPQDAKAQGTGNSYYVDSENGDDSFDGLSEAAPWKSLNKVSSVTFQPGDSILFKAGGSWAGSLTLHGSGAPGNPITLGKYGEGSRPLLHGDGQVARVIYMENLEYWTIQDLEITNGYPGAPNNLALAGIYSYLKTGGVYHGLTFRNLDIHFIEGSAAGSNQFRSGAIMLVAGSATPAAKYDGVLIEDCSIHDLNAMGIYTSSLGTSNTNYLSRNQDNMFTNVVIRNVSVINNSSSALILADLYGAVVENVVTLDNGYYKPENVAAVMVANFPVKSTNITYQYNETARCYPTGDSQAWDADYGLSGTNIWQYNYSHDNPGGFFISINLYGDPDMELVVRYNISQNDMRGTILLYAFLPLKTARFYNNVIYNPDEPINIFAYNIDPGRQTIQFYNNIFVGKEGFIGDPGNLAYKLDFDSNVFYGFNGPEDPHKLNCDPQFIAPGTAADGIGTTGGYKLKPTSPCINTGKEIPDNGGRDFWGNPLYNGAPDRGAFESGDAPVAGNSGIFEAEDAVLDNADVQEREPGQDRTVVKFTAKKTATCLFEGIDGCSGGVFAIKINYANNFEGNKLNLYIDGKMRKEIELQKTDNMNSYTESVESVRLLPGIHSIMLEADGSTHGKILLDKIIVEKSCQLYEAENGVLATGAYIKVNIFASGWKYVKGMGAQNASCTINNANGGTDGGYYKVNIRYSSEAPAVKGLYVNGAKTADVILPATGDRLKYSIVSVPAVLAAGMNSIGLVNDGEDTADINLDSFEVINGDIPDILPEPSPEPTPVPQPGPIPGDYQIFGAKADNVQLTGGAAWQYRNYFYKNTYISNVHYYGAQISISDIMGGDGGLYHLILSYATNDSGAKAPVYGLYINGERKGAVYFAATGGWYNVKRMSMDIILQPGSNEIKIINEESGGGVCIDQFIIMKAGAMPLSSPVWAEGSKLTASDIGTTKLKLTWSPAGGERAITKYKVYRTGKGDPIAVLDEVNPAYQTPDGMYFYNVAGLAADTGYTFNIQAVDDINTHAYYDTPVTVRTLEAVAPVWPEGSSLTASDISSFGATLVWTAATDNTGVASYEIYNGNSRMATIPADTLSYDLFGILPDKTYTFTIKAVDAAGNISTAGNPTVTVTTPPITITPIVYEAENGTWGGGDGVNKPYIARNTSASGGAAVDGTHYANAYVQISNVEGKTGGKAILAITYANGAGTVAKKKLEVNGITVNRALEFAPTGGWRVYKDVTVAVDLISGANNTIKLSSIPESPNAGLSYDKFSIYYPFEDATPPSWPEGSILTVTDLNAFGATLSWTAAEDNRGVASYAIFNGTAKLAEVPGNELSCQASGLMPDTRYTLTVKAVDAAGNISTTGNPTAFVATPATGTPSVYEAENGTWGGGPYRASNTSASGGASVEGTHYAGAYIQISNIDGGAGGKALLTITYGNGISTVAKKKLEINGAVVEPALEFPSTGGWRVYKDISLVVDLLPGAVNTIKLSSIAESLNAGVSYDKISIAG